MNDNGALELFSMLKDGMHNTIKETTKEGLKLLPAVVTSVSESNNQVTVLLVGSDGNDPTQYMDIPNVSGVIPSVDDTVWVAYMYSLDNAFVIYVGDQFDINKPRFEQPIEYYYDTPADDWQELLRKKFEYNISKFNHKEGLYIDRGGWKGINFGIAFIIDNTANFSTTEMYGGFIDNSGVCYWAKLVGNTYTYYDYSYYDRSTPLRRIASIHNADGGMEIGTYVDFHVNHSDPTAVDYDARITARNSTPKGLTLSGTTIGKISKYTTRPTTLNLTQEGTIGMSHTIATTSTTSGKPKSDAHVIHMSWDTNAGWDSELAVGNGDSEWLAVRSQTSGTWDADWHYAPVTHRTATQTDFNNIREIGWYYINPNTTTTNRPVNSYGILEVVSHGYDSALRQYFVTYNTGRSFVRTYLNSQWYPWFEYQSVLTATNNTTQLQGTSANIGLMGSTLGWYDNSYTGSANPTTWGFCQNFTLGGVDVHQLWMEQNNGAMYHRGINGGSTPSSVAWKKIYDSSMSYTRSNIGTIEYGTNNDYLITKAALAFWNGAYSGTTSNLSVLGTVTKGTWNGSTIGVGYGGTGATTAANARTNLGIGLTELYSGDLTSGSATLTNGKNYKMLLVCGQNNTSSSWSSVVVPTVLLSSTATRFQISDDVNYVNFNLTTSGNNVTFAINARSADGRIRRVYGVN